MTKRPAPRAAAAKPHKPAPKTPIKTADNGRTAKGTFAPGNPGGPGRKPLAVTLAQHVRDIGAEVIDAATGWTRLDAMIRRLYSDAIGGKTQAADVILERGWGKVMQPVEMRVWQTEYAAAIQQGALTLKTLEDKFGHDGTQRILSDLVRGGFMSADEVQAKLGVALADNLFNQRTKVTT